MFKLLGNVFPSPMLAQQMKDSRLFVWDGQGLAGTIMPRHCTRHHTPNASTRGPSTHNIPGRHRDIPFPYL